MAAPAWATNMSVFYGDGATTVTALGGGPAGLGNPETDFYIEGSSCISKGAWAGATRGFILDSLGTTFTVPTDGAVIAFAKYDAQASLDTKAGGGFRLLIGSANNAYDEFYVGGSDTMSFDSWVPYAVDPNTATPDISNSGGAERWVGVLADVPGSGPTKGNPIAIDAVRYGRCDVEYTLGDASPNGPNTFDGAEAYANNNTRRWGLIQLEGGAYVIQGFHSIGVSGTACYFQDSNKVLFWRDVGANNETGDAVSTGFNRIEIINASTDVDWENIIFASLGTRARGVFVVTSGAFDAVACQFIDMDTFDFLSSSSATGCVFRRCNAVTAPGTDLTDSSVLASTVAADTAALVWDTATDTDGLLDGTTFSKGTNAHHAIEFTTFATSFTLNDVAFGTGFNASNGNNDSTLYFPDTGSDRAWVINLVGCTGNISYKTVRGGDTVSLVINPVTLTVTVVDSVTGAAISGARVYAAVTSTAGGWPFEEAVTSITQSAGTATVTHTAHGLSTNDWVLIEGASPELYNGVRQITVTGVNTYTYSCDSGLSSPATGSITATFVVIQATSNGSGVATGTYSYSANQPVLIRARSASGSPYYKAASTTATINSTSGASVTVGLIPDE